MFAIVEINGCILNFAVKNPAIDEKNVVANVVMMNAKMTLPQIFHEPLSITIPNIEYELPCVCNIIVVKTVPKPIIRPMDKSVPANNINPATPSEKKTRVEALDKIFMIVSVDNNLEFLITAPMKKHMKKIWLT